MTLLNRLTFNLKALFFLMPFLICAQQIQIKGFVKDSLKNSIPFVSIIASNSQNEEQILAYSTSKENGSYVLMVKNNTNLDSIWLTYRHMQYETLKIQKNASSQNVDVVLKAAVNKLDDIILNAKKKIEIKGDTITYNVAGLKKEKDYSIEEVINRIPGVTISDDGQIRYKERPISHLYINGVDLLEGKYNIATRGIPASAVEDIDIMQKHNHARIDIGKTASDNVAFNLKIKEDHSLVFGSSKGDLGVPFLTGNAEITPIYLKEKLQDIASFKVNNIGKSLKDNGRSLTSGNRNLATLKLPEISIINKPDMNGTVISNKYWLDNESYSITNDALYKTKNDVIFKAGINHNYNFNQIERKDNSAYYFDNDSTIVNRNTKNQLLERKYDAGIVAEVNKDDFYLKNKTMFNAVNSDGSSSILQNQQVIDANYLSDQISFSNSLELKTSINDKILNSGLLINYQEQQEELKVLPTQFVSIFNPSFTPDFTQQLNDINRLNIGAFSSYNFDIKKTKLELKQTINWSSESLLSSLTQNNSVNSSIPVFPFATDYKLNSFQTVSSLFSSWQWKRFTFRLNTPVTFINLNQENRNSELNSNSNDYVFFEPSINASYKFNQNWNSSLGYNRTRSTSTFNQLFTGLQLRDFASLSRNPNAVNVSREDALNHFLTYKSILKGVIISNNFRWFKNQSDFTISSSIDDNGLITTDAVQQPNILKGWSNRLSFTKSFFRIIKTDLSYSYRNFKSEQFFNDIAQENINRSHSGNVELTLDNNTWYGISYEGIINYGLSQINDFETSNTFIKHKVEVDFYLSSKTRWNLGTESVISTFSNDQNVNRNTLFNTSFYYKPSKKLFLRASLINIFNEDFFTTSSSNANFINISRFSLRPRQFTLGFNYTL